MRSFCMVAYPLPCNSLRADSRIGFHECPHKSICAALIDGAIAFDTFRHEAWNAIPDVQEGPVEVVAFRYVHGSWIKHPRQPPIHIGQAASPSVRQRIHL